MHAELLQDGNAGANNEAGASNSTSELVEDGAK